MAPSIRQYFLWTLMLGCLPAFGQTISLEPRDGVGNDITVGPGATITIEAFAENLGEPMRGYTIAMDSTYANGDAGTIDHDGETPIVDTARSDFVFFGLFSFPAGAIFPLEYVVALANPGDSPTVTERKYLGEVTFVVSPDAVGNFTIDTRGNGVDTILATPDLTLIDFTSIPANIVVICLGDEDCDDDLFCNGVETCVNDACVPGKAPCVDILTPLCDEDNDVCVECLLSAKCDDGIFCNGAELCVAGFCEDGPDEPFGTPCGDPSDSECNGADQCDGAGACDDNILADDTLCDDGLFCTTGEFCTAGVCGDGGTTDCDDLIPCTTDSCNEDTNGCDNPIDVDFCLIDGTCFPSGKLNPGNECEFCDAAVTNTDWSLKPDGTMCLDDGAVCTDDVCASGVCDHPNLEAGVLCDDGVACTGTGAPGVGFDECDGLGACVGTLDPNCADDCVNAIEAFEGANFSDNTGFGDDDAEASCQPLSNHDAWFRYTPQGCIGDEGFTNGVFRFNTEGSDFTPSNDTVLNIFDACGGSEVACDDDSGTGLLSSLLFNVTSGTTYFIRVAGFLENTGPIQLNITREDTCFVDGECYADGMVNPNNECQICDANLTNTDWSPRPKGLACGSSSFSECDSPDACDGAGTCEANHKPDGTACPDDGNDCSIDVCQTGICAHPPEPIDTPCGSPSDDDCDNPDSCDGAGLCLDNLEDFGFACGDPTVTDCDLADICDGGGACLDNLVADLTPCTDDGNDCTDDFCDTGLCAHPDFPRGTACGSPNDDQCDNPDTCDGIGLCLDNFELDGLACDDSDICTDPDACMTGVCTGPFGAEMPDAQTLGPRAFSVTPMPPGSGTIQAIRITSPDHPCMLKYVDASGGLTDTPVFMTPDDWGTIAVTGAEIISDSTYEVRGECATILTDPIFVDTYQWGDTDGNNDVDIFDIFCVLDVFNNIIDLCPFEAADMLPCGAPNGDVDLFDIFAVLDAFALLTNPCAGPCNGGACCIDDECVIADDQAACEGSSGAYEGDGVDCFPFPCSGPSPTPPSDVPGRNNQAIGATQPTMRISLETSDGSVGRGNSVEVLVYAENVRDLRGYEFSLAVSEDRNWRIVSATVPADHEDYVFADRDSIEASNDRHTLLAATLGESVSTDEKVLLGSFVIEVDRRYADGFAVTIDTLSAKILGTKANHLPFDVDDLTTNATDRP